MTLFVLAYLGGVLTILSPCILPVLPFVFARSDQPFVKSALPLLAGMAVTFAAVATLAAVGGAWAVRANEYGRIAAIVLLALFGITLLFPAIADWLTRPLVAAGARLSQRAQAEGRKGSPVLLSFLLGIATAERALHRLEHAAAEEEGQCERGRGAGGIGEQQQRCLGVGPFQRRAGEDEAENRRRVDPARIGRCGAGRCRRDRARARYGLPHPHLDRVHLELRTVAARSRAGDR
jgi:hypothetical protein